MFIICPKHGIFEQIPHAHLSGKGCPKCGKERKRKSFHIWLEKVNKNHSYKYDYSLVQFINLDQIIKIICPIHGIFEQTAWNHYQGKGCPHCVGRGKTTKSFIEEANKVHNNFYDYSLVRYKCPSEKIKIICPIHGVFEQTPASHLSGRGCPKCYGKIPLTIENFIERANKIHNYFYNYSEVIYKNNHTKVKIICPKHEVFEQIPSIHLNGSKCPKCISNTSKGEKEVAEYVKSIYSGLIIESDRKILNGKELDIYLPDLGLAIEYNGVYWHKQHEKLNPGYHKEKAKLCKEKNIFLLNICDKSWDKNPENIKNKIKQKIDERNSNSL